MTGRESLDGRRRRLTPAQQALLAGRVARAISGPGGGATIPRRPGEGPAPLSSGQERLWFLDAYDARPDVYNRPANLRLVGALDVAALRLALREIFRRHDALRSRFVLAGETPVAEVVGGMGPELREIDLSGWPDATREAEARRRTDAENLGPFDLGKGPVARACLLRLGADEHWLVLTFHHIVFDGWSEGVLWRELGALQGAFTRGEASPLAELPIRYGDFAAWQRAREDDAAGARDIAYWKERLAGARATLDVRTDLPRPKALGNRGELHPVRIDGPTVEALRELGRQEGATLFMTLAAAFGVLLTRQSGQEELCLGTPVAGRIRPETEGLIGCFINTVVLRADFSGDPSFRVLLGRVRDAALGAFAHQELPFERLVAALNPRRALDRTPLFETMLVLRNTPQEPLEIPGLRASRIEFAARSSKFALTLALQPDGAALSGVLEYSTELFRASTIERWAGQLGVLIAGIVADPDRAIARLPLMGAVGRRRVLSDWNGTAAAFPESRCVHGLFADQAARTPEVVAVVDAEGAWNYREVDARADRIARALAALGVAEESRVGVCLPRSAAFVVAMLGVFKCGATFVPIDPAAPPGRLSRMLEDAAPSLVLVESGDRRPTPGGVRAIALSGLESGAAPDNGEAARAWAERPGNAAYVMFTSGSTGRPKGVVVEHRSLANKVTTLNALLGTGPGTRHAACASVGFDPLLEQILCPLLAGGTVAIVPDAVRDDPRAFAEMLRRCRVTVLDATPDLVGVLLSDGGTLPALDRLLVGGDVLPRGLARRILGSGLARETWNLYGPTETCIDATSHRIDEAGDGEGIPIGRPLPNYRVYILDGFLEPVPVGVTGELYIGGIGLARGYIGRPGATSERFVADPHASERGARMYRTGDLGRWRGTGEIEFEGRADRQLKVNGVRVEPAEIEAALSEHPRVGRALVDAWDADAGDVRLAAWVVPRPGETAPGPAELRAHLAARVPGAMVPAAFVVVVAIPMSANGKPDRAALPVPRIEGAGRPGGTAVPRTPVEERVAGIWSGLLGRGDVGMHDDFFALGGHSLMAMRMAARFRDAFGIGLPMRVLFENPTPAGLARWVERARLAAPAEPDVAPGRGGGLRGATTGTPVIHVPGRFGFEFLTPRLAALIGSLRPYFDGLQFPGFDGRSEIPRDGNTIVADLVRQIEAVCPEGPLCLSGHSWGGALAFEIARRLAASGRIVENVILFDSVAPGSRRKRSWPGVARVFVDRVLKLPAGGRARFLWELARNKARLLLRRAAGSGAGSRWVPGDAEANVESERLWNATEAAAAGFRTGPYDGDVLLFHATVELPNESLRAERQPGNGWGPLVRGRLTVIDVPSVHAGVFKEPIDPAVLRGLGEALGRR